MNVREKKRERLEAVTFTPQIFSLQLVIPVKRFLEPEETNVELIRLYFQHLLAGTASPKWCPLLYLVAVHHTNRFFYTQDGNHTQDGKKLKKLKTAMIQEAIITKNQVRGEHGDLVGV